VAPRRPLVSRALSFVASISPTALFFGPVFTREAHVLGRRKATYFTRMAYALMLLGVVSFAYLVVTASLDARNASGNERVQELQQLAPIVGIVIAWFQFAMLVLIAPVLTGGTICDEKRRGTLAALACTPLTSPQIILSLMASRLLQLLILGALATPLLLAVRTFGGLEAEFVLGCTCVAFSAAVLSGALGLTASIYSKRAVAATTVALVSFAAISFGPLLVYMIGCWVAEVQRPDFRVIGVLLIGCPPAAHAAATSVFPTPFLGIASTLWVANTAFNLTVAGLLCAWSAVSLRRVMLRQAGGAPASGLPSPALAATGPDEQATAANPGRRRKQRQAGQRRFSREVGDMPVLWREVRVAAVSRRMLLVLFVGAAVLLGFIYWHNPPGESETVMSIGIIGSVLCLLLAVPSGAGAVAGEVQARTWPVLIATPLSPGSIIVGKIAGAVVRQWPCLAILTVHFVLATLDGAGQRRGLHPMGMVFAVALLLAPIVALSAFGTLMSLVCRRASKAMVATFAAAVSMWIVFPMATAMISAFGRGGPRALTDVPMTVAMVLNPVFMVGETLDSTVGERGYARFSLPTGSVGWSGWIVAVVVNLAVYLGAAYGCTVLARRAFARLSTRGAATG
jgi:ABC-type transport system involved in multi-copper enzyme maturation permease subunit